MVIWSSITIRSPTLRDRTSMTDPPWSGCLHNGNAGGGKAILVTSHQFHQDFPIRRGSPSCRLLMLEIQFSMSFSPETLLILPNTIRLSTTRGLVHCLKRWVKWLDCGEAISRCCSGLPPMPMVYLRSEEASWTRVERQTFSTNCWQRPSRNWVRPTPPR